MLLLAAGTTGIILAPLLLVATQHFVSSNRVASSTGTIFQPWQAWWFTGSFGHVIRGFDGLVKVGYRYPPVWIRSFTHPLILAVSVPLSLLWWRLRNATTPRENVFLLLALILLLRCVLDPFNNVYYSLPFLMALLTWETLALRRAPALTLAFTAVLWVIFQKLPGSVSPDVQSLAYMGWALPVGFGLAARLYAPDWLARNAQLFSRHLSRYSPEPLVSHAGDSATG